MPKITIVRPDKWFRKEKSLTIFIDHKEVGNTDVIKDLDFEVSSGIHNLLIKNKWGAESNLLELDLSNNVDRTIKMWSSKYIFPFFLILATITTIVYSSIRSLFDIEPDSLNNTFILILMYLLIFVLLFRKNYLKLKEVGVFKEEIEVEQVGLEV